jgi:hypothetical protein
MEKLVGKLIKVNEDVVFLADEHLGVLGVVIRIVDKMEKFEDYNAHPEILQHLIIEDSIYGQDIMFDVYTSAGERLRLFYNEFTIME